MLVILPTLEMIIDIKSHQKLLLHTLCQLNKSGRDKNHSQILAKISSSHFDTILLCCVFLQNIYSEIRMIHWGTMFYQSLDIPNI